MGYEFWRKWLQVVSLIFTVQSIGWAILGSFDPFGFYDHFAARGLFGTDDLPSAAQSFEAFILGPFGATTAGFFILVWFLTKYGIAKHQSWALFAVATAVLFWFAIDTATCVAREAYFNIWIVNVPCLAVLTLPLLGLWIATIRE